MPRPISQKFLAHVEALKVQIYNLISEARTIEQAGELKDMLEGAAVQADVRVCQLDN